MCPDTLSMWVHAEKDTGYIVTKSNRKNLRARDHVRRYLYKKKTPQGVSDDSQSEHQSIG